MGEIHCRVARGVRGIELSGVYDPDATRSAHIGRLYETVATSSLDALFDRSDAIVVAAPSSFHASIALDAIAHGCHVLIEKPIALNIADARAVASAAASAAVVCAVGHVERHNATFEELQRVLADDRPLAVSIRRLNYFAPRIGDADVTLDLLIHDIDLVRTMAGEEPRVIYATGLRVLTERLDHVDALLSFPGGVIGSLTASRITEDKIRRIEVSAADRYVVADLLRRTLTIHKRANAEWAHGGPDVAFRLESVTQQVQVPAVEPLHRELTDLMEAIQVGRPPKVVAEDGVRALEIALEVQRQAEQVASGVIEHSLRRRPDVARAT
ncbi:MAG: Gfo/Idh/MocA family oxidoreductase [Elusimicrobia bacterium]|nr:Gfo/Idh/MocA family oxidoreductase [Elusimicrobiota bacterium]